MEASSPSETNDHSSSIGNMLFHKTTLAIAYACRASIHNQVFTERGMLCINRRLLLALLYGLVNGDLLLCYLIGNLFTISTEYFESSSIKEWININFNFSDKDIANAFRTGTFLNENGRLNAPPHVMEVFFSLSNFPNVIDIFKKEGNMRTLTWLESIGADVGIDFPPEDNIPTVEAHRLLDPLNIHLRNQMKNGECCRHCRGLYT